MISEGLLKSNKHYLETEVKRLTAFLEENPDPLTVNNSNREFERGDDWSIRNVAVHNHRATRDKLEDCKAALKRMDDGTYGFCTDCGKEIAEGRIQAMPEAKRCTPCQSKKGLRIH